MRKLFRKILVPHDFSPAASHALVVAADLAAKHGGKVTALHVLTPFYTGPGYPTQDEIAWTPPAEIVESRRIHLEQLVRRTLGPRARGVTCRAVMGEAVPAILDAARRADAIVMSTLGRSGLAHLLIGSVAAKVVRHSPIPVLTVRAATPRGKRRKEAATRGRRG